MSITSIHRDWGVDPSIVRITTTNTLAEASTTGYILAQHDNIVAINNGEFSWLLSDMCLVYASDGWMFANISSDFESLIPMVFTMAVVGTPVVVGNFAVFASTGGNLEDLGYLPSDAAKTNVVMAGSATVVNRIAHFVDTEGTIDDTAANVTNLGNILAGASGTPGTLTSFPATAGNGSLIISALNAGGPFDTTIRNSIMGQSTVYSLGDIGAATGGIPVSTAPILMKKVPDAAAAGGSATQNFVDAFCDATSVVLGFWNTSANAVTIQKIVPGVGSFDVISSADAGVGTFNYCIIK